MGEGIDFDVEVVKETEKAFLLRVDGDEEEIWVPKSQVIEDGALLEGETGTMTLTTWVAEQKGLA